MCGVQPPPTPPPCQACSLVPTALGTPDGLHFMGTGHLTSHSIPGCSDFLPQSVAQQGRSPELEAHGRQDELVGGHSTGHHFSDMP